MVHVMSSMCWIEIKKKKKNLFRKNGDMSFMLLFRIFLCFANFAYFFMLSCFNFVCFFKCLFSSSWKESCGAFASFAYFFTFSMDFCVMHHRFYCNFKSQLMFHAFLDKNIFLTMLSPKYFENIYHYQHHKWPCHKHNRLHTTFKPNSC